MGLINRRQCTYLPIKTGAHHRTHSGCYFGDKSSGRIPLDKRKRNRTNLKGMKWPCSLCGPEMTHCCRDLRRWNTGQMILGVFTFSPGLCGFSPGVLVSSHILKPSTLRWLETVNCPSVWLSGVCALLVTHRGCIPVSYPVSREIRFSNVRQ